MTSDERDKAIQTILRDHDRAIGAIRTANEAMKDAHDAMRLAIERHDDAMVRARLASRSALQLLHRW